MIDREARLELKQALEDYLAERIMAFEFDERIFDIKTEDETVRQIVFDLWYFYDDCRDHYVHGCRWDWNFFQRILLFLETDGEIMDRYRKKRVYRMDYTQLLALLVLVGQLVLYLWGLNGWHVIVLGGLASLPIWLIRRRRFDLFCQSREEIKLWQMRYPFSTLSDIYKARRELGFVKQKFPAHLKEREIRSDFHEFLLRLQWTMIHFIFSPIILLYECLPMSVKIEQPVATKK